MEFIGIDMIDIEYLRTADFSTDNNKRELHKEVRWFNLLGITLGPLLMYF